MNGGVHEMMAPVPCDGCGSDDYEGDLRACPRCAGDKCSVCDMGDDVECASCAEAALS